MLLPMHRALFVLVIACRGSSQPEPTPTRQGTSPSRGVDAALVASVDAEPTRVPAPDEHEQCELRGEQIVSSPPLPAEPLERDFVIELRRKAVHEACEEEWSTEQLAEQLAEIDELADGITKARKTPSGLGCPQVVSAHYADAKWRGKLDGFSAIDRKQMIARSRDRMTKACGVETWSELLRACVVVGGGARCFEASRKGLAWGYPAAGTVTSLGIADCDAYGAAIAAIASCARLSEPSRAAIRRTFDEMQAHLASLPAIERAKLASSCRAGRDAVKQVAVGAGC